MLSQDIITKTNDGYVVELFAKVGIKDEIKDDFEGISILEPAKNLVEDELYSIYKDIVEKMDYKPIILKAPEKTKELMVLKTQIRAILRAAVHGDLSIVFSKVATVMELKEYKEILQECQKELELENTPYKKHMKTGIIVEIPSTALMAYELAKECDFLFIDTNSLTNYAFGNKKNPEGYQKFQPAIIKLLQQAIVGAHDAGIFCGICGEVAEDELYMPVLIGLGIDQFSIEINNIEKTRKMIYELDKSECKEYVEEILQLKTLEEIEKKLKQLKKD